ncbi:MAG: hypothetical protein IJF03_06825 [Lachnospiraceae bacterium]|nr:hypothetical protein [Lachnospiraceae bacterium]
MKKRLQKNTIEYRNYLFIFMLIGMAILYSVFFMHYTSYDFEQHNKVAEWIEQGNFNMEEAKDADIYLHILSYPLYHILTALASFVLRIDMHTAMAIVLTIANVVMVVLVRWSMLYLTKTDNAKYRYFIDLVSCTSTIFVNMVSPLNEYRYYARQGAANPIHNPTIMVVKPFGILALVIFCQLLLNYKKQQYEIKEYVLFSVILSVGCVAKPSLLMVLLPAMGLLVLKEIICDKALKLAIYMFLAVSPSLITLIMQFLFVNAYSEELATQVVIGGFSGFTIQEIFLCSFTSFPVVFCAFSWKALKEDRNYQVAILTLIIGWLQMFFLTQGSAGNYSWGYIIGIQMATIVSLVCTVKYKYHPIRKGIIWLVYAYQVICGIKYMDIAFHNMKFWF